MKPSFFPKHTVRKIYNVYNEGDNAKFFASPFFFTREVNEMRESGFQARLIRTLKERFPGCVVLKNDANYIQGIPDLTVFYRNKWAMLECKRSENESHQPNQDYYVERMDEMSFARFIFPENMEEVLDELERSFKTSRSTRFLKRK